MVLLIACAEPQSDDAAYADVWSKPIERIGAVRQVETGRQLYATHCASCHGNRGEGTIDGPAIVGRTALPLRAADSAKRDVLFRSVGDVLTWTMQAMPADNPATLTVDEYVAITAYVVSKHITLGRPLDAMSAHAIALHPSRSDGTVAHR